MGFRTLPRLPAHLAQRMALPAAPPDTSFRLFRSLARVSVHCRRETGLPVPWAVGVERWPSPGSELPLQPPAVLTPDAAEGAAEKSPRSTF